MSFTGEEETPPSPSDWDVMDALIAVVWNVDVFCWPCTNLNPVPYFSPGMTGLSTLCHPLSYDPGLDFSGSFQRLDRNVFPVYIRIQQQAYASSSSNPVCDFALFDCT